MRNKGYTLIELLAVIVIIGVVATMTIFSVNGILKEQKEKTLKLSMQGIVDAVSKHYANSNFNGNIVEYRYENESLSMIKRNGVNVDGSNIKVDGKIERGVGNVYVIDNGDVYGGVFDGEYCVSISPSAKEVQISNIACSTYNFSTESVIKSNVATDGDGLYLEALDNTYRYKGSNPSNYIRLFDGENGLFRIIAFENQGIKVISDQYINRSWDIGNVAVADCTDETCPRNNNNNTYCKKTSDTYYGCNAWNDVHGTYTNGSLSGIVSKDSTMLTYLKDDYYVSNLNGISDKIVLDAIWNVGPTSGGTLSALLTKEESKKWTGKIGLINTSDYVMAQIPGASSTSCYESIINSTCGASNTNWLKASSNYWTMNAVTSYSTHVYYVYTGGSLVSGTAFNPCAARPVIYLKKDLVFTGTGTSTDPYRIIN